MVRGENNDYVIDYNRAEIRFTPRTIITANLRIIVEFEYSVQNYQRSLYATETSIQKEKWLFNLNSYSEQDSKSLGGNIQLDSTDLRILEDGGDTDNFKSGIYRSFADLSVSIFCLYINSYIYFYLTHTHTQ